MWQRTLMTIGCLALVAASSTPAAASSVEREFNESFDVAPGTILRLVHGDGDVEIRPWTEDRVEIAVRYHVVSRGFGGPRDFEVDFDRSGEVLRVVGREIGGNVFLGGSRTYEYSYRIQGPPYLLLELRGDDGDVEISDWAAAIDLRSEDGDVTIDGLDGDLVVQVDDGDLVLSDCDVGTADLRLEDGDVTLRRGSGEWRFVLDDGDLELRNLAATMVEARTEDGDITIDLAPAPGFSGTLRTDDGDVSLGLHAGFSAHFSIQVDDGSIALEAPDITVEKKGRHGTTGTIGGGGGLLKIETSDGDVTLRAGD